MSLSRRALQTGSARLAQASRPTSVCCRRAFSATARAQSDEASYSQPQQYDNGERPRWDHTPERMKAPFSINQPKDPRRSIWAVNEDPNRLYRAYDKLIGRDMTRSLPEELRWLAVTHKSFDNGRRGFNTRLAFYGRMLFAQETTRFIMSQNMDAELAQLTQNGDPHGRTPFSHPALDTVDKLNLLQPHNFASPAKLAALARNAGLPAVVRWKPRMPDNLEGSGITTVMATTVFAIVGAVGLQNGAAVASRLMQDRIIKFLKE